MPRVLVACEMSGRVRTAFAKRGWYAQSCDLLPDETEMWNPPAEPKTLGFLHHYQGDVRDLLKQDWDLVIAHPPCTDLSQAGANRWKEKQADGRQEAASEFFKLLYHEPVNKAYVVVENPVGYMNKWREPDQVVEPWWFGEPLSKKICLWYRPAWAPSYHKKKSTHDLMRFDLPLLVADQPVESQGRVCTGGGSWRGDAAKGKTGMNRWEDSQGRARRPILRSITSASLARAMADQWGPFIEEQRGN